MQNRLKFRVYFKGSEYAEASYIDLTRHDVIFSLRADGQIIRNVVYDCKQEGHEGQPCNMPFTPNNNLYDIQFCTGLKDKNGKLIYEGDIVYIAREEENVTIKWDSDLAGFTIVFMDKNVWSDFDNFQSQELEVIGNIYEPPELLEKQQK